MLDNNPLKPFATYAESSSEYVLSQEEYEATDNYKRGYEPLDSLPATWYNSILNSLTQQANQTYRLVSSIYRELVNVIGEGELDSSKSDQLSKAIQAASAAIAATSTALGSIKLGFSESATGSTRAVKLNTDDQAYVDCRFAGSGQAGLAVNNDTTWGVTYPATADGKGTVKTQTATATAAGLAVNNDTTWGVTYSSGKGTVKTQAASTSVAGIVQLNDSLTSDSTTLALTAKQGKALQSSISSLNTSVSSINTTLANKKNTQTAITTDPTASGTASVFVTSVQQNAQGVITVKRSSVAAASTTIWGTISSDGILQLKIQDTSPGTGWRNMGTDGYAVHAISAAYLFDGLDDAGRADLDKSQIPSTHVHGDGDGIAYAQEIIIGYYRIL